MAPEVCRATYRVQLHAGFGLTEAAVLADYLTQLGVSHLERAKAAMARLRPS